MVMCIRVLLRHFLIFEKIGLLWPYLYFVARAKLLKAPTFYPIAKNLYHPLKPKRFFQGRVTPNPSISDIGLRRLVKSFVLNYCWACCKTDHLVETGVQQLETHFVSSTYMYIFPFHVSCAVYVVRIPRQIGSSIGYGRIYEPKVNRGTLRRSTAWNTRMECCKTNGPRTFHVTSVRYQTLISREQTH